MVNRHPMGPRRLINSQISIGVKSDLLLRPPALADIWSYTDTPTIQSIDTTIKAAEVRALYYYYYYYCYSPSPMRNATVDCLPDSLIFLTKIRLPAQAPLKLSNHTTTDGSRDRRPSRANCKQVPEEGHRMTRLRYYLLLEVNSIIHMLVAVAAWGTMPSWSSNGP